MSGHKEASWRASAKDMVGQMSWSTPASARCVFVVHSSRDASLSTENCAAASGIRTLASHWTSGVVWSTRRMPTSAVQNSGWCSRWFTSTHARR